MNNNKTIEKRAGFTQAPWIVKPGKNYYHIHGAQEVALVENWMNETPKANAHLIASAPELYEQCKTLERALDELAKQADDSRTGGCAYAEQSILTLEALGIDKEKLREVLAKADGGGA